MSAYNTVSARLQCPSCGSQVTVSVQFKYGNTWQIHVVDGVVEDKCPKCDYDNEWNVYVHIEDIHIARVENADGRFDFVKAASDT